MISHIPGTSLQLPSAIFVRLGRDLEIFGTTIKSRIPCAFSLSFFLFTNATTLFGREQGTRRIYC